VTVHCDLPEDVRNATREHLRALDATAPGLVAGLYLTGSVALGDYQPGRSDIDFMAFTTRPPTDPDVVALLAELHGSLKSAIDYDGNYVALAGLPDVPDDERPAPHVVTGEFRATDPNHQLTPATWTEFARYAIAIRGPEHTELGISVPRARLAQWTLGNLNSYWKRRAEDGLEMLRKRDTSGACPGEIVAWDALGAARLHYTLATGDIASKSAAGEYAISLFPDYTKLVTAALSWRTTGAGEFTNADWGASAELILDIVADANRRWAQ
jgi:hypothetical protein